MAKQDLEAELEIADDYAKQTGRIPHLRLFISDGPIHLVVGGVPGLTPVSRLGRASCNPW